MSVMVDAQDLEPVLYCMRSALDFQRREILAPKPDIDEIYDYADILSGGLHILESMSRGTAIADFWMDVGMEVYGDEERLHYRARVGACESTPCPSAPIDSDFDGEDRPPCRGRSVAEDRAIVESLLGQGE